VIKIARALAIFGVVAFLFSPFAKATPEFSKKESKQCVYCHTAVGKPDLNEAGKYYKAHDYSLEGFEKKKEQ
jgi:hypothetical protein